MNQVIISLLLALLVSIAVNADKSVPQAIARTTIKGMSAEVEEEIRFFDCSRGLIFHSVCLLQSS